MGRRSRRKQAQRQKGRVDPNHHPSRRRRRKWIAGTLLAIVAVAGIVTWQWKGTLWAYKKAPSFTLQASTGQPVSLQDYQGKKEVVLVFYMGAG